MLIHDRTDLHYASKGGIFKIFEHLLEKDIVVNNKDQTALNCAIICGRLENVQYLLTEITVT